MADISVQKKQDDYFKSNINNFIEQAVLRSSPRFSEFFDERQRGMAEEILRHNKWDRFLFFGGADGCERVMLGVFPETVSAEEARFPILAFQIVNTAGETLSHRDYLGALMSLQIKREKIGDIVVEGNRATVFVARDIAPFLQLNLTKIGRCAIRLHPVELGQVTVKREYEPVQGTVSSLRLDCVVAFLLNRSRRVAEEAIASHLVKVNGTEASSGARQLAHGDTVVIRGKGKFLLNGEIRKTKKDRLFLTVNRLV